MTTDRYQKSREMLARADAATMVQYAFYSSPATMILRFGSDALKQRWVPRLARGEIIGWVAMTEPEAGSDVGNVSTTATPHADGTWRIAGRKQFISNGYDAGLYVVYANTNPKVGMLQGTSSFLVPRDTPGLTVARCNETLGCRFMNNGEMVFEDMFVPDDHLLVENSELGSAGVYFRPGKIIQDQRIAAPDGEVASIENGGQGREEVSGLRFLVSGSPTGPPRSGRLETRN